MYPHNHQTRNTDEFCLLAELRAHGNVSVLVTELSYTFCNSGRAS